jgi:DNA-binding response OmpR family regulator
VVLIVEDNARLAGSLSRGLAEEGFVVAVASTVAAARERLAPPPDAIVLDLGLPDGDGLEVLAHARAQNIHAPVLVLTAQDAVQTRVDALDRGADDFLVKPFAFAELVARLKALLRRAAGPRWSPLAAGDLVLEPGEPAVRVGARRIALSPRERALLEVLVRRTGEVLGRADLLREAFD